MRAKKHNSRRKLLCGCALLMLATTAGEAARVTPSEAAYAQATAMRDRLEAQSASVRTPAQYAQTLDGFRAIYHRWPTAGKAPAAVEAVGELLAEEGRDLKRQHDLEAARGQFEFLLTQYPKSPEVAEALLNEGELCANDLHDATCAQQKLKAVVRRFPGSSYAEQAALDLRPDLRPAVKTSPSPVPLSALKQTSSTSAPARVPHFEPAPTRASERSPAPSSQPDARVRSALRGAAPALAQKPQLTAAEDAPVPGLHGGAASGKPVEITGIRHWSNPVSTRIAIDLSGEVEYEAARVSHPDRIFFDLHGARLARGLNGREVQVIDDGYLKRIRAAQFRPDVTRVVLDVTDVSDYSAFLLPNPWRLILDIHGGRAAEPAMSEVARAAQSPDRQRQAGQSSANTVAEVAALSLAPSRVTATTGPTSAPTAARVPATRRSTHNSKQRRAQQKQPGDALPADATPATMAQAAQPTSDGERSLVRALGLKVNRIVIDAGHGGHDSGTLGPGGIEEKDVVLDVALRTGRLLEQQLGAKVIYTRDDDTFVPLETRTAIANKAQADLFLSIHANSSPEPSARGVETYYLNFTSDPQALEVAARENAVSDAGVHQLSDLVRKIALKDKIDESRELAADVDTSLYRGLGDGDAEFKDRGVKKAPFVVLIGAQMPSVLAEISFLTNPEDARLLRQSAWRERIAESLAAGVERYLKGLSSAKPAMEAGSAPTASGTGDESAHDER